MSRGYSELSVEERKVRNARVAEQQRVRRAAMSDEERKAVNKRNYDRYKEKLAAMSEDELAAHRKKRTDDRRRAYREATDEERKAVNKRNYDRYKEKLAAMSEKDLKAHRKRRASDRAKSYRAERQALLWTFGMEANWICYICGEPMSMSDEIHLDHIEPESKGGSKEWQNRQATHGYCNQIKGDRSLQEVHDYLFDNPDLLELRYMTSAMAMSDGADKLAPPFYGRVVV